MERMQIAGRGVESLGWRDWVIGIAVVLIAALGAIAVFAHEIERIRGTGPVQPTDGVVVPSGPQTLT